MNRMTILGFCLITLTVVVVSCKPATRVNGSADSSPQIRLQALVNRIVADNPQIHGAAVSLRTPGFHWEGAAGLAAPGSAEAMTPSHPVRIASNTKTYVAAAILRLMEEGKLSLDDPIARHLSDEHLDILASDGYDTEAITLRHLLTHSSGLYDHSDSDNYGARITAEPQHRWTRTEQLQAAVDWGEPWAEPGAVYHYADTGYILLGSVVERVSGTNLATALRELLHFDELGLDSTWLESEEEKPSGLRDRAHQYLGELDTHDFDPSFDLYGGGGIACTVGDLETFMRALFTGRVFREPATLAIMLTTIDGLAPTPDADAGSLPPGAYRMGIWEVDVDGLTTYRHTGFWGTLATWVPDLELSLAVTVNQNQGKEALLQITEEAIRLAHATPMTG